ncbi:MAG: hypothetical protein ACTHW2_09725 [Tissierella sp.]|uniref:hypothetical protein n=1 Tax=Tissierella sp. TaxID=41274 RepID=UPI003F9540CD
MKIFLKDSDDRYITVDDMDMVFTYEKEIAHDFSEMDTDEFAVLKGYIEGYYEMKLETIFE